MASRRIHQHLACWRTTSTPPETSSSAANCSPAAASLDDAAMSSATQKVMHRLKSRFKNLRTPVMSLSGGQRQSVAIARAVHFNAKILIMDEPTADRAGCETSQVRELVAQLKSEGIGIFLISHDIHDVFDLADRISVMLQGKLVGTVNKNDVTKDEVLAMIIMGKKPDEVSTHEELADSTTELAEPQRPNRAGVCALGLRIRNVVSRDLSDRCVAGHP